MGLVSSTGFDVRLTGDSVGVGFVMGEAWKSYAWRRPKMMGREDDNNEHIARDSYASPHSILATTLQALLLLLQMRNLVSIWEKPSLTAGIQVGASAKPGSHFVKWKTVSFTNIWKTGYRERGRKGG